MTSSVKQELLALLTRRTQQARENASRDIHELLRSIEVFKQAGKLAECPIQLPNVLARNIAKRLSRIRLLTYVQAVEESVLARKQRNAVLQATEQQLIQTIEKRKSLSDSQQAEIERLKAEAAQQLHAKAVDANRQREVAIERAARINQDVKNDFNLSSGRTDEGWASVLLLLGWPGCLAVLVCGRLIMWLNNAEESTKSSFTLWLILIPVVVTIFVILLEGLRMLCANMDKDRQLQYIENNLAADQWQIERSLSEKLPNLQKLLAAARISEDKARAALKWFQGQVSGSA